MIKTKKQRNIYNWIKLSGGALGAAAALLLVLFAGIPTSSAAIVTFANNGNSEPFYWLTRPSAVFYNNKTYVVWHGTVLLQNLFLKPRFGAIIKVNHVD